MGMRNIKGVQCKPPEWTDENCIAYYWCIAHGVTIATYATTHGQGNRTWEIEVRANGRKITSPKEYGPHDIYEKVFELYRFYYNKHNK